MNELAELFFWWITLGGLGLAFVVFVLIVAFNQIRPKSDD